MTTSAIPDLPDAPGWLAEAVQPLTFDEPHKWPDKVRRALMAEDAARLIWREMHDPKGWGPRDLSWLCEVLVYFRDYPRANDREGWAQLDVLADGPMY